MIEAFEKLSLTSSQYYTQLSTSQFSQRLIDCPPIKRLDSIMITNFKSFKGKTYVGPLLSFTSIIGSNGAGKSNVLDALMFCLCNEKSKLTFYDVREFIQREGNQTYSEMQKKKKYAQVQANFILTTGDKLTFKRTLYPNQSQHFSIDGDDYPLKVYENFLIRCNLNCITSNFAIWQGQVDKLILKNPKELTVHLQNVSGSVYFKKDQQQLKAELQTVQQSISVEAAKLVKLRMQKKNIKKLNITKDNNLKTQQQYEQVLKKLFMIKAHLSHLQIRQAIREKEAVEKQESKKIKQLNENKVRMQREQTEKIEIQSHMNQLMKEIAQANTRLKTLQQSGSNLIDAQTLKELQSQIHNIQRYATSLSSKSKQLQRQSQAYQSLEIDQEYLSLYSKWQKDNEGMNRELTKLKNQYIHNQQILNTKKNILEEFKQKSLRLMKNMQDEQHRKKEIESNISELDKNISKMKMENGKASQQLINNHKKLEQAEADHNSINQRIIELESLMLENIQNEKDKQLIQRMASLEGFKGLVEQWVKPAAKKYQLCFHVIMSSILKYILCSDEKSSKLIAVKLREYSQIRTLVILGNVNVKKEQISRAAIGKSGQIAIDIMQFDKSVHNLQQFLREYLSGKIICDNLAAAWQLLSQNIRGIKQIYTLDGNVLRQDGVISTFGSVDTMRNKYKYVSGSKSRTLILQQMQALQKQKSTLEMEIGQLKQKLSKDRVQKCNIQISKLQTRKYELASSLTLITKGLQNKKEVKIPKSLEKEIEQAELKVDKIRESMSEIQKEMVGSKIFTDFLLKNKINSLDSFRTLQDFTSLESKVRNKNKTMRMLEEVQLQTSKVSSSLAQKEEKYNRLKQKIGNAVSQDEKAGLLQRIKRGEEELINLRGRLAKMNNINMENLKFKTQIPHLKAKISLLKERHQKFVKAESALLGLEKPPQSHEYKQLQQHLRTSLSLATKQAINEAYQSLVKQSKDLQAELDRNNLDITNERIQAGNASRIDEQIISITESLKQLSDRKVTLNQKLEGVKRDRKSMFMNFFDSLRPIVQDTYQRLTKNNQGISGKVDIYLQNDEFPCDDGVYFYPTPPTKRLIYELDQLSGGQKSIASLSLQYSIAMASKSPFLILDQIDAFLDGSNVLKFVDMVNDCIRQQSLQFILITHKRSIFTRGQSLVGINKAHHDPFSRAYSLLLQEEENQN